MGNGRGGEEVFLYVIDADASVRDGLCRLAIAAGFEARSFVSIEQFTNRPVLMRNGCVLLDSLQVPGGRSAASSRDWPGELPVIVLCGNDGEAARAAARSFGARFFLNKPVDAQALFDAIAWVTDAAN